MEVVSTYSVNSLVNNMSTGLEVFDNKQYEGVMDLMYALKQAGFTDEFDNSLVMRSMWFKVEEMKLKAAVDHPSIFLKTKLQENPAHTHDLIVTLNCKQVESVTAEIMLFVRDGRIAVNTNVLTEEVQPSIKDIPLSATTVYWFEAEKLFKAHLRFSKEAFKAFKAVYKSVAPKDDDTACRLRIMPTAIGWSVEYRLQGEKVLSIHYAYSK